MPVSMTVILSPLSPLTLFITKKNRYKKTYFFSMSLDVTLHNADDTNEKKRGKKMGEKKKVHRSMRLLHA